MCYHNICHQLIIPQQSLKSPLCPDQSLKSWIWEALFKRNLFSHLFLSQTVVNWFTQNQGLPQRKQTTRVWTYQLISPILSTTYQKQVIECGGYKTTISTNYHTPLPCYEYDLRSNPVRKWLKRSIQTPAIPNLNSSSSNRVDTRNSRSTNASLQRSNRLAMLNSDRSMNTPVSIQDGVIGTGFTLSLETVKNQKKICETMVFKTLDMWQ